MWEQDEWAEDYSSSSAWKFVDTEERTEKNKHFLLPYFCWKLFLEYIFKGYPAA